MYNIRPHLLSLKQSTVTTDFILFFSSVIPYTEGGCHKQKEKRGNKISYQLQKYIFYAEHNLSCIVWVCIFFIIYLFLIIFVFPFSWEIVKDMLNIHPVKGG